MSVEDTKRPEILKTVSHAWLFDIDGPVTHPETKSVKPELLDEIIKRLEIGEPIAFISGRAMRWIEDQVEKPLVERIDNPTLLDNLMFSGEFGGFRVWYENGIRKTAVDRSIELPKDLEEHVKEKAQNYSGTMFVDPDKKPMVSVEMGNNTKLSDFKEAQKLLDRELRAIVENAGIEDQFEVHSDTIATNLRHKNSNKRHATSALLDWIRNKGISPQMYFVFGDASSDREIVYELDSKDLARRFVFVGEEKIPGDENTISTNAKFDQGTLEFLRSKT